MFGQFAREGQMGTKAAVQGQRAALPDDGNRPRAEDQILVVGAARSGTTWVGRTLGLTADSVNLSEPDEAPEIPFATRARAGMGALPVVKPGEEGPALYRELWDVAFGMRRRSVLNRAAGRLYARIPETEKYAVLAPPPRHTSLTLKLALLMSRPAHTRLQARHRVVRSVQVALALEWVVDRLKPRVVVVRRHPLDIVASRVQLGFLDHANQYVDEAAVAERVAGWPCPPRPSGDDAFANLVWLAAFEMSVYDEVSSAHRDWIVVDHEDLCVEPVEKFRRLAGDLGLQWTDECQRYLESSNRPGEGFDTKRVSSELSGKWKTALSTDQVDEACRLLRQFPIARRYADLSAG
jgi:hypothetical protein